MKVEIRFTPDGVPEPLSLAEEIYRVLDAHRGEDIAVLHVGSQIEIADYFVLCTATSTTHVRALTDEVEFRTSEAGGDKNSWMVLDYGSVMVHVFTRDARQFYNLDKLYSDTEKVEVSPRAEAEEADSAE